MIEVILIGAARSGTKFLRSLLGAAAGTAVVPYDIGYVWRHGLERVGHDELRPSQLTPDRRTWIRQQVRGLGVRNAAAGRPSHLIEKSVPNSLRPAYVAAVLPQAHIVHLVRDGRQVVESARRSWRAPTNLGYAVRKLRWVPPRVLPAIAAETLGVGPDWARAAHTTWGPRYAGIDKDVADKSLLDVCAIQWSRCVTRSLEDLEELGQPVHSIDFDDLVIDPGAVGELAGTLGLDGAAREQVLSAWRATADPSNLHKWRGQLDDAERHRIAPLLNPVNELLGHGGL